MPKKGYKQTPEHMARVHTPEANIKRAATMIREGTTKGPNNPRWLGGISKLLYAWEFNDELKEKVRCRDNYVCQLCDTPQTDCKRALDIHHIDYNKKNSDPINLITLCHPCHMRTNTNRERWTMIFQYPQILVEAMIRK